MGLLIPGLNPLYMYYPGHAAFVVNVYYPGDTSPAALLLWINTPIFPLLAEAGLKLLVKKWTRTWCNWSVLMFLTHTVKYIVK